MRRITLFIISAIFLVASAITAWSAEIKVVEVMSFDMLGDSAPALPTGTYYFLDAGNMKEKIMSAQPLNSYTNNGWRIINTERMTKDWHRITLQKEEEQQKSVSPPISTTELKTDIEQLRKQNDELKTENQQLRDEIESIKKQLSSTKKKK